jgi:hypothetical protein
VRCKLAALSELSTHKACTIGEMKDRIGHAHH